MISYYSHSVIAVSFTIVMVSTDYADQDSKKFVWWIFYTMIAKDFFVFMVAWGFGCYIFC
jgi:hypothetical protein